MVPRPGSVEYFWEELHRFREAFGNNRNSLEKLDQLFCGLFYVAAHTEGETPPGWEAICVEWPRRRVLMAAHLGASEGK
jgi:hypothetical protein